jgi:hypothetical protein
MANDSRIIEILLSFLLIISGVALLFDGNWLGVLLLLFGLGLLNAHIEDLNGTRSKQERDWDGRFSGGAGNRGSGADASRPREQFAPRLTTREWRLQSPQVTGTGQKNRAFKHAIQALRASGHDPERIGLLPVDIGLMVFRARRAPELYRTRPIPEDVDSIQPFVVLDLPTGAIGRVRFELIDAGGQILFIHEDMHDLEAGRTLISPAARLPLHEAHDLGGPWMLRVFTDDLLLATHYFLWETQGIPDLRPHLRDDGELGPEIRVMLTTTRLQRMSLDDLLGAQDQNDERQRLRRSS